MATRQGSDKDKFLAWVLNKEHGYAASRIANLWIGEKLQLERGLKKLITKSKYLI